MKKKILIFAGIFLVFFALAYGFMPELLGGKVINQSDISGWRGMVQEMSQWNSEHPDDPTAWSDSMFGGMPTISFQAPTKGDWTWPLYRALIFFKRPASYLFISLIGAFLLMLALGISPLVAAGGAIAVTFCAYNIQIIQVGHNTKMQALGFLPWVLAAVIFTYRSALGKKKRWLPLTALGAALFGLFLSFQVKANHPQISYYLALMMLIYVVSVFISILKEEDVKSRLGRFFAASALLLVLGLAGIGTNANKLIPTWNYTQYSMRGGASDGSTKGLDMGYATAWSYGWEELPNLLIPNFNGGASSAPLSMDSETVKLLKRAGQQNLREVSRHMPLYWGPQPFTAGPMYMGAITIFLFVLGLCLCRGREKWWMLAATLLAVFLGLGSNMQWFTTLFYRYAPLYSKFRTVSMALVILQFTLPMLAFVTLDRLVKEDGFAEAFRRKGWIAAAVTGGFCLLFVLLPSLAGSFVGAADAGQADILTDALAADRQALLVRDALRSLLLIAGAFALLMWGCWKPSMRGVSAVLVCVLVVLDLFSVGKRYLTREDFVTPKNFDAQFALRPVDEIILEDPDPSYRVLDLTASVFNDSHCSYWHKSVGGYSPAKLQIYQEYIDSHLSSEINTVYKSLGGAKTVSEAQEMLPELEGLSKLNCRYIILGAQNAPLVYPYAKGPAWFEGADGNVDMLSYAPNELRYACSSAEGGKVVFSEVYYPDGWTASLEDGTELPISLSDEVLRAVEVPAGQHQIVMRFAPRSYAAGESTSRACSILLILMVLLSIGGVIYGSKS